MDFIVCLSDQPALDGVGQPASALLARWAGAAIMAACLP
jgi:hypothetical protein